MKTDEIIPFYLLLGDAQPLRAYYFKPTENKSYDMNEPGEKGRHYDECKKWEEK
jgi:hypothetical protein